MNPAFRKLLENIAKNATNAALTALGPVTMWSSQFNFNDWHGIKHILLIMGSAAISREVLVYVPQILQWSQSTEVIATVRTTTTVTPVDESLPTTKTTTTTPVRGPVPPEAK